MFRRVVFPAIVLGLVLGILGCAEQGASVADAPPAGVQAATPKNTKARPRSLSPAGVTKPRE